ncbi:hypothetical protein [Streptomyces sp. NBC_00503]|uniref:hypothetical protein n=1 Tax=Streptomyces sp. NBC_00503 TaxID=2903659 RepID=UPI002E81B2A1|nr:hypothetical protein [Streptomyces sp. NBC_00503]WUD85176.1 hypothetical protein OG490_34010 [Streptomyces sp. NBC_00503]
MRAGKAAAGIAVAFGAVVATAGCSATAVTRAADSAEVLAAALGKASDEATGAGSAEIKVTTSGPQTGGKPVVVTGLYSWGNGLAMEGEIAAADVKMQKLVADGTVTVRLVQGAYYYNIDPVPAGPLKGKSWLKLDASAVMGENGAAALKNGSNDPTAGLKLLKYAKGVSKVGKEDVNGKAATHYHAKISTAELGDAAAIYQSMGGGATDLVADVWIDDKGMPARMTQAFGALDTSMDFLSFGGAKEITAPPAAETADMTEMIKNRKPAA